MEENEKRRRRSIRLPAYDYTGGGGFFVTICTHARACLFGNVVESHVQLNELGRVVHDEWFKSATLRPYITVEEHAFVVMPNHVHGVLWIDDAVVGARRRRAPEAEAFGNPVPGSLATIVRAIKSITARRINELRGTPGEPVWQRNYYERVIRDERDLRRIIQYIADNPLQWQLDEDYRDGL